MINGVVTKLVKAGDRIRITRTVPVIVEGRSIGDLCIGDEYSVYAVAGTKEEPRYQVLALVKGKVGGLRTVASASVWLYAEYFERVVAE